jgi:hypothetical protein
MTSCLSKLKVTPSFWFAFKIPDDMTATNYYYGIKPRPFTVLQISRLLNFSAALHFGNFVTVRAAKSIISSKCVFNPSYGLPGVFKIKILYLDKIFDHI